MPELPEVETVVSGLSELIVGKTIKSYTCDNHKSFPNDENQVQEFFIGATIIAVKRRAKAIIIELDTDYTLLVHLKMTGQMVYVGKKRFGAGHPNDSFVNKLPDKSTRVEINFSDKTQLFFNDQRKFGWMLLLPTSQVKDNSFIRKLGPEPLSTSFTNKLFVQQARRRNNSGIKAVILDQSVLSGVGNIYADESLWMSEIHPETRVKDLHDERLGNLRSSIVEVLSLSIEKGGSTDKNYVDAKGNKGSYLQFANVFRLEGKPCKRCGNEILKIKVAGRGTHICSFCQPKPKS